jgi:hypothetical protein
LTTVTAQQIEPRKVLLHKLHVGEKTNAMTPDKMDRTSRGRNVGNIEMPYPLTEEEATPTIPESERNQTA